MKYKRIKGMLHNLTKSFSEGLHFVKCGDAFAVDEICNLIDQGKHDNVVFDFLNYKADPGTHSDQVMNLFKNFVDDHDRLLKAHGLDRDKLDYVRFTISKAKKGYAFKAEAVDDRGVSHEYVA